MCLRVVPLVLEHSADGTRRQNPISIICLTIPEMTLGDQTGQTDRSKDPEMSLRTIGGRGLHYAAATVQCRCVPEVSASKDSHKQLETAWDHKSLLSLLSSLLCTLYVYIYLV